MTIRIPFTYQGSKAGELHHLAEFIPMCSAIVEPFIGTGIVSYHFGLDQRCIGNDLNRDVASIWDLMCSRSKTDHNHFIECIYSLLDEKNRTEKFYYEMRELYNDHWKSDTWSIERSALFYYLMNACHAGMIRYGKNGFNSSFKLFLLNGRKFNRDDRIQLLKDVAKKFRYVDCMEAVTFLSDISQDGLDNYDVIYCDPPYTLSASNYIDQWNNKKLLELDDYLAYLARRYDVYSVMSNYYNQDIAYQGKIATVFEKKRMASTKITVSNNIIIMYGEPKKRNEGLEMFV